MENNARDPGMDSSMENAMDDGMERRSIDSMVSSLENEVDDGLDLDDGLDEIDDEVDEVDDEIDDGLGGRVGKALRDGAADGLALSMEPFVPDGGPLHMAMYEPLRAQIRQAVGPVNAKPIGVALRGQRGEVAGGAWGTALLGWLQIDGMVVVPELRGQGLGAALLHKLEQAAQEAGCHAAWVDTFEFQARGFYEKQGYCCFGSLQDFPRGSQRHYLFRRF
jgi:GNAT superfamily N-acetyltransferase